jgi:hypothetical protein
VIRCLWLPPLSLSTYLYFFPHSILPFHFIFSLLCIFPTLICTLSIVLLALRSLLPPLYLSLSVIPFLLLFYFLLATLFLTPAQFCRHTCTHARTHAHTYFPLCFGSFFPPSIFYRHLGNLPPPPPGSSQLRCSYVADMAVRLQFPALRLLWNDLCPYSLVCSHSVLIRFLHT